MRKIHLNKTGGYLQKYNHRYRLYVTAFIKQVVILLDWFPSPERIRVGQHSIVNPHVVEPRQCFIQSS